MYSGYINDIYLISLSFCDVIFSYPTIQKSSENCEELASQQNYRNLLSLLNAISVFFSAKYVYT